MSKPKINEEYTFEKKKKLAARISDMRDKETLRKIRDIIFAENPEVSARKSSNGYLMYFQNYADPTYFKIEKYLNKIEKEKLDRQTRSIAETSEQIILSSEADEQTTDYTFSRTRLGYSNRERRLIKRRQYENIINEKILDSDAQDDNSSNDDSNERKTTSSCPDTAKKGKKSAEAPKVTGVTGTEKVTAKQISKVLKSSNLVNESEEHNSESPVVKNSEKASVKPAVTKKKQPTIFSKVRN